VIYLNMHLLAGILREHLPTIGGQKSPEDICSISLERLWLLPDRFLELLDKPELDELVLRECAVLLLQGCHNGSEPCHFGPQSCQLC